jgi:hypothetical protein
MVLAEHYTKTNFGLTATTTETVRFQHPTTVTFRLVRGPVPFVAETFALSAADNGTVFRYEGERATDLGALGAWWGTQVASVWERTVNTSMTTIAAEAERRATGR